MMRTGFLSAARSVLPLLPIGWLLALGGCFGGAQVREEPLLEQSLPEVQPTDEILGIFKGQRDTQNQFASTVFVAISGTEECSGVLIHPRLVLTAAHCVCRGRENDGTTTLDSSTCEKAATVRVGAKSNTFKTYRGEVRPYPEFKVILKKKKLLMPPTTTGNHIITEAGKRYVVVDTVAESKADLAVILLKQAIENPSPHAPLARDEIKSEEPVVIAGYGADAVENGVVRFTDLEPTRRFGKNFVTKVAGETFMIEVPGALALPGDSGGPCFREEKGQLVLVGIASRVMPGKRAKYTSTYRYLDWLDKEIKRANVTN